MLTIQGNGTVPLTGEDARNLNLMDKMLWIENEASDDAELFNTDLVERQIHTPVEREYKGKGSWEEYYQSGQC
jgi:hypothetical protein